jgi:hypothetical protein
MPNLLNGLVNGWVKVNNKHVIFLKDDGRRDRKDSDAGASLDESSSSKSRALDRSRGKSNRTKQSTATTVSTAQSSMDPEALAIKKFNSKRQNNEPSLIPIFCVKWQTNEVQANPGILLAITVA